MTVSIGAAMMGPDEPSFEGVTQRADTALYRAKADGRNRVCCEPTPPPESGLAVQGVDLSLVPLPSAALPLAELRLV